MLKNPRFTLSCLALALFSTGVSYATEKTTSASTSRFEQINEAIENALAIGKDGGLELQVRYRFENHHQDNTVRVNDAPLRPNGTRAWQSGDLFPPDLQPQTANANTVRTKVGLLTPSFYGIQGFVEYSGTHLLSSDFNSGQNGRTQFSTIRDPRVNRLNQLWLNFDNVIPDTEIRGGRQTFHFDDMRYIASMPWRQSEGVMDSVLVTNRSIKNLRVQAAYIGNINAASGLNVNMNTPLLNLNYSFGKYGNLIGYGYWIGYTSPRGNLNSNQTYGIRFTNSINRPLKIFDNYQLLYTAEWAHQKEWMNNPVKKDVNRYYAVLGTKMYDFLTVRGSFEQMDGVGANQSFITPLGMGRRFNGWSEIYIATPALGLRQWNAEVTADLLEDKSLQLTAIYRTMSSGTGRFDYGDEWNIRAQKRFGHNYTLQAAYTYHNAATPVPGFIPNPNMTDTQRITLQAQVDF